MGRAAGEFGERVSILGNIDPVAVMLQGSPEDVYRSTINCMKASGRHSISGAGCEIPDGTPPENLHAQSCALREFSSENRY
jgi:uroporphyrinogen-III decarboxylase